MPTVLRLNGYDVMIYTHDHLPRHVHVFHGDSEVIMNIDDLTVVKNFGMSGRVLREAQRLVAANQLFLHSEWDRIKPIP